MPILIGQKNGEWSQPGLADFAKNGPSVRLDDFDLPEWPGGLNVPRMGRKRLKLGFNARLAGPLAFPRQFRQLLLPF
jgi:hypothetical protein